MSFSARSCVSRVFAFFLILFTFSLFLAGQASPSAAVPRPLHASEVMAIQAGGALPANIAHDVASRGLDFRPDDEFLALLKKAGADATVLSALKAPKVSDPATKPDMELLRKLSEAAVLMKSKNYDEAGAKLNEALDMSFARMETGFVMAELMAQRVQFGKAAEIYAEILQEQPDFPELHDKSSYVLYRLGDDESALNESRAAIADYRNDAEAHMNAALSLSRLRNFDASILEFKEALRIKPDYAAAHSGIGLLHQRMGDDEAAIAEYKNAIAIDPEYSLAYYNLGTTYLEMDRVREAIAEFQEAKRLCPDNPEYWQNLGSALMRQEPRAAVKHFREMEVRFPNFEICHVCLGNALLWSEDLKGAELEFQKAMKLEPGDASPHVGLGDIRAKEKNFDAALDEYRTAEGMDESDSDAFKSAGKLLLDKKDFVGAAAELKKAEALEQSSWEIHELYGKALAETGQSDLAIAEFKEAVALDANQGQVMSEIAVELEKKGDWVGAMEQYRKGAVADENRISKVQPGGSAWHYDPSPRKQYTEAKVRFADHLAELRAAGKKDEAAELEKRVAIMDAGGSEKVREAIETGDRAFRERRPEDAEKAYKQAVELGDTLPPSDESMILALNRLGSLYGMQHRYDDAQALFHRQLSLLEKAFGPSNPELIRPLFNLGSFERERGNYVVAENYFSRAYEINVKNFGENSVRTAETLRALASVYEKQQVYDKAEPYLLRAVKASEVSVGPDDNMTLVAVWALCGMYDQWGKPDKAQPCWHRATGIMEKNEGMNSPALKDSLTSEANALRKLGRKDEALKLEERVVNIQKAAAMR